MRTTLLVALVLAVTLVAMAAAFPQPQFGIFEGAAIGAVDEAAQAIRGSDRVTNGLFRVL